MHQTMGLGCASTQVRPEKSALLSSLRMLPNFIHILLIAAKSWQLGWYAGKSTVVNPLVTSKWSGRLVGIADYDDAGGDDHVLVKIETETDTDFYMNFNRQTGFNSGTVEGGDQVLITTQGGEGTSFAKSTMVAKLSAGQSFEIVDFGGSVFYTVRIMVDMIDTSASPGYADISITRGPEDPEDEMESESIFLNCGGDDYFDGSNLWKGDTSYFETGSSHATGTEISNTDKQEIYRTERYGWSGLLYSIPLADGEFDIR